MGSGTRRLLLVGAAAMALLLAACTSGSTERTAGKTASTPESDAAEATDDNGGLPDTTLPDDACGLMSQDDMADLATGTPAQARPVDPSGKVSFGGAVNMFGKEIGCTWSLENPAAAVSLTVGEAPGHNKSETKQLADTVYEKLEERYGPKTNESNEQLDVKGVGDRAFVTVDRSGGSEEIGAANQGSATVLITVSPASGKAPEDVARTAAAVLAQVAPAASENAATTTTTKPVSLSPDERSAKGSLTISGSSQDWLDTVWEWKPGQAIDRCNELTLSNAEGDFGFFRVDDGGKVTFGSGRIPDYLTGTGGKISGVSTQKVTISFDGEAANGQVTAHLKGKFEIRCP